MPMTPKEMLMFLLRNGFQKVDGGKGGHQKVHNPTTNKSTLIPMHSKELGKGLESKILKQTGLKK